MSLRILCPLPRLLNVNGDAENALVLERRAQWAGIDAEVVADSTTMPDAIVIGSGFDGDLGQIADELLARREQLRAAIEERVPVLAIGTGLELLTDGVLTQTGEAFPGLGLLPGRVAPADTHRSGDVVVDSRFGVLVGFENHGRRYLLPDHAEAFGTVLRGEGNGIPARTEGVVQGSLIATRMHGPVLARNPVVADHMLATATKGAYRADNSRAVVADRLASRVRSRLLKKLVVVLAALCILVVAVESPAAVQPQQRASVQPRAVRTRRPRRVSAPGRGRDAEQEDGLAVFEQLESEVRSYVRSFPVVFGAASGAVMRAENGDEYLDFLSGASALNYGHGNPLFVDALIDYLRQNGITHSLDLATVAKRRFLERFDSLVLRPRGLDYKVQFTGPTGTNAVEAALKLSRLFTGRSTVVSFTHGFHGVSTGSLAVTAARGFRTAAGTALSGAVFAPYDGYLGPEFDSVGYLRRLLRDPSSGLDRPAAVIVETVQGEGGVNVAGDNWLRELAALCAEEGILLVVDDIQAGCGRTGPFFSFERAGIVPDMVTLSKSISGIGLPMSLVLLRRDLDVWAPGAHSGTFRGNNLAFVCAAAALERYWSDDALSAEVGRKGAVMREQLTRIAQSAPEAGLEVRGAGMLVGLASEARPELARQLSAEAFDRGLIVETCGAYDEVLKLMPPLTIDDDELNRGLDLIADAVDAVLDE